MTTKQVITIHVDHLIELLFKGNVATNVTVPGHIVNLYELDKVDGLVVETLEGHPIRCNLWTKFGWENECKRKEYWENYTSHELDPRPYMKPMVKKKTKDEYLKLIMAAALQSNMAEAAKLKEEMNTAYGNT